MKVPTQLLRETIVVSDYEGSGSRGPKFGAQRTISALMQPTSRLVTDTDGNLVTVGIVMIIRPEDGPVAPRSKVVWGSQGYRAASGLFFPDSRRPTHYEAGLVALETS